MSLYAPFADLASWQFASEPVTLPAGLRYSGYAARALRATRTAGSPAAAVQAPAASALRKKTIAASGATPGLEVIELTPLVFRFRDVAQRIAAGVPTFYFLLPEGSAVAPTDQQVVTFGETLSMVSDARLVIVFPDRLPREPALGATLLLNAINAATVDATPWQSFATAVTNATATAANAPVILLDHAGRPLTEGNIGVTVGAATHSVTLAPEDAGNLQAAIARMNAASPATMPIANLWGGGAASATLAPAGGDMQLARLEDALSGASTIAITRAERHVMLTDLHRWFAEQFAIPAGRTDSPLARFTRGNRFTPLVNGHAMFDDLFARLDEARASANGGFHLAGWSMFADEKLGRAPDGASPDFPLTLLQAANLIGGAGGGSRFLAVDFIQVADPSQLETIEVLAVFVFFAIELLKRIPSTPTPRDGTGLVLAFAILIANAFIVSHLLGDGVKTFEPNQSTIEALAAATNSAAFLSGLPFNIDDNPLADLGGIVFGAGQPLFRAIEQFGVYHQKLAVVRRAAGFAGYCGGIDCNPDRLDDARHLAEEPYHDVHARIDGPAVKDLIVTFDQRWQRDGSGAPAFTPADADAIPNAGAHVVQVGRTYGASAAPARQLWFAPNGDRTLLGSVIAGIRQAREFIYIEDQYLTPPEEYINELVAKVASGTLRKLIIVVPSITDQPLGETRRTDVIDMLRDAAGNPDIVRVGSPRRHFTVPTAPLRSSSGRLVLREDIMSGLTGETAVALGPLERLPEVPFWLSVDGELMWVYDESVLPNPDPTKMKIFKVERGDGTRIVSGVGNGKGSTAREHKSGTAATLVNMNGIYVHSKLMIVDDVFLSVGSANLNRRGFYSDGECNVFTVPQALRTSSDNPVRALRKQLWAEMLDIPLSIGDPLLEDPVASSALFDRSYFLGNRYVEAEAFPKHLMIRNFAGGDGLVGTIFQHLGVALALAPSQTAIFDTLVDPSSSLDPFA